MKNIAILDGSLNGIGGNTNGVICKLLKFLPADYSIDYLELKSIENALTLEPRLRAADSFILGTGTYWQSWGSPMQRFLEQATDWEGTDLWMGKPVCTIVTMHSVGGVEVMSRLQANFALFGAMIPPICSLVFGHITQMAQGHNQENKDLWDLSDLDVIAHNFTEATNKTHHYRSWDVDRGEDVTRRWLEISTS